MRTSQADILMVPGWQGSGPDHWQSRWERSLSTAHRVEQGDWSAPDKDKWVGNIIRAVASTTRPAVLVAHSLGVHAVVHALGKLPEQAIAGVFLVAPPDIDNPQELPVTDGCVWPPSGFGFTPTPLAPLSCPSVLLASADDPYCRVERARHFAAAWGADLVEIGPAGHVNAESGHGPRPDGALRFGHFLARLEP
jgi:predicted alpha/beta hydrolase family esterase